MKLVKNDKKKIRAKCKIGCPWTLYARVREEEMSFEVRTYNEEHVCGLIYESKNLKSKWLVKIFLGQFWANPNWTETGFKQAVLELTKVENHPTLLWFLDL